MIKRELLVPIIRSALGDLIHGLLNRAHGMHLVLNEPKICDEHVLATIEAMADLMEEIRQTGEGKMFTHDEFIQAIRRGRLRAKDLFAARVPTEDQMSSVMKAVKHEDG